MATEFHCNTSTDLPMLCLAMSSVMVVWNEGCGSWINGHGVTNAEVNIALVAFLSTSQAFRAKMRLMRKQWGHK